MATKINYDKFNSLKQQKFLLSVLELESDTWPSALPLGLLELGSLRAILLLGWYSVAGGVSV